MADKTKMNDKNFKGAGFRITLMEQNDRVLEARSKDMTEPANFEAFKGSVRALHGALVYYRTDEYKKKYDEVLKNIRTAIDTIDKEKGNDREKQIKKIEATIGYYEDLYEALMELEGVKGFLAEEIEDEEL